MANRVPLTLNTSSSTIEELPSGDNLELSGSNIANVGTISSSGNITATGNITASVDITATGNIIGNYMLGNGALLTGIVSSPGGSNTQIQYNNDGSFGGVANLTFDGSNISLGPIGNVKISGGSNAQYIQTDGTGNLSFATITADTYMLKPVLVATTANIILSGTQTIDGVSVIAGDRVLVWQQGTQTQNGIYVVSSGSWTRATDFDTGSTTLSGGVSVAAISGSYFRGVTFICTNNTAITVGSTNITFQRASNTGLISIWTSTSGFSAPAIGANNGGALAIGVAANAQLDSTAIGYVANATGSGSVAYGYGATATGARGVAIGLNSRASEGGIAIGREASFSAPNAFSVAIGHFAARNSQRPNAIAIGNSAGFNNQGTSSIAIGANAGYTNQANNSIVINATGANLEAGTANALYVKPIRNSSTYNMMYYTPGDGEIVYAPMRAPRYSQYDSLPTGQVGEIICIDDSSPAGMMAYWDTTNARWSYIHDNSAV